MDRFTPVFHFLLLLPCSLSAHFQHNPKLSRFSVNVTTHLQFHPHYVHLRQNSRETMSKTLVLFGATGLSGLCVTEISVRKGFKTRTFVRDPARLPDDLRGSVEVFEGDVLTYDHVYNSLKGADAVVYTLGTRGDLKPTTLLSDSLTNIIKAMKQLNIGTISVCLSAFLFFDIDSDYVPDRLKDVTRDHKRMYDVLKDSGLNYVAVFCPHISSDPGTGYVAVPNKYIAREVSKWDLALFLVESLDMPQFYGKPIGIGSKPKE